jgi:hypothetical protein
VLDSETTGLTPPVQFVEIAIVEAGANTLFEDTIRPVCRIAQPFAANLSDSTSALRGYRGY